MWQAEVSYKSGTLAFFKDVNPVSKVDNLVLVLVYNNDDSILIIPISEIKEVKIYKVG